MGEGRPRPVPHARIGREPAFVRGNRPRMRRRAPKDRSPPTGPGAVEAADRDLGGAALAPMPASDRSGSHGTLHIRGRKTTVKDRKKEIGEGLPVRMPADLAIDGEGF